MSSRAEVLELVVLGRTNKEVAADLGISENTVKQHVKRLMAEYGASTRTELAWLATAHLPRQREAASAHPTPHVCIPVTTRDLSNWSRRR